ncbi:MAG: CHASE2 domain-containing protein [Spirochaetota bacterium]
MKFIKIILSKNIPFFISLLLALMFYTLFIQTELLSGFENMSLDFRFYMRDPGAVTEQKEMGVTLQTPNPLASDDIMILAIDEETIRFFGEEGINWPYPWEIHSTFIDFVTTGDPNCIVLDIMFLDHKPGEEQLAESFRKSGKVLIDYPFEKKHFQKEFPDQAEREQILGTHAVDAPEKSRLPQFYKEVIPPVPSLTRSAKGVGHANVEKDIDEVNRKSPLVVRYEGKYYPSIVLVTVMNYYGIGKDDLVIEPGEFVKLTNIPEEKRYPPLNSDTLTIPINGAGQMNINYVGSHGAFNTIPYYYFYNEGSMEGNDSLNDKIVLVAAYSITGVAHDVENSPFGEMFGIEHHAHAINTIIQQLFLHSMTDFHFLLLMLGLALLTGIVLPRTSILISTGVTVLLALGHIVLSHFVFERFHYILAYSTPVLYIVLNYILITTYRIFSEQKEKLYIRKTFSKFVSKGVVDELLRHPEKVKLGGEKKNLTVLFSDIRGFTSISEQLTPEELVEHLNIYLQTMTDIVINYDGTLDKYIGDAIMAFWGAPIPQEDHAFRACSAAIEMMSALDGLNRTWESEGKPPLEIGIGLNSGDMVVGNMGSASRMDYTLMGDNVNLGARLEGTNKVYGTHIIISEYTYEVVKDRVYARELDHIRVKGKARPVTIYELMGIRDGKER